MHRASKFLINNGKELVGTLDKPTPISEQLSIMNIVSALVLSFFFKSL